MVRRFSTFIFAALLAAQCALPCFGDCAAATPQPKVEQEAVTSAAPCHGSAAAAPASETVSNIFVSNAPDAGDSCCCLATPAVPPSGESPVAPVIRDSSPVAFTLHIGLESDQHDRCTASVEHYRAALPPGPPLFIAHHSLLI